MKDKSALLRVVKSPDGGEIRLDRRGKLPGRGAYVCPDAGCLRRARKARALERVLETAVPAEVYDALEAELTSENKTGRNISETGGNGNKTGRTVSETGGNGRRE